MTDLAVIESKYAALANPIDGLFEALSANVGSGAISEFDLSRVKVPTGGASAWEVPTLDGSEPAKELRGVVVGFKDVRAYWAESFGGGSNPPDCSSQDSITGIGNPGGECAVCPMADFGSKISQNGTPQAGQACKAMRLLFVLQKTEMLPLVLAVPPTSLRPIRQHFIRLASQSLRHDAVESIFTLEKTKSNDGIEYSRIVTKVGDRLSEEERARAAAYTKHFGSRSVDVGAYASE